MMESENMSDWIDINLPWSIRTDLDNPDYPDLIDKMPPELKAKAESNRAKTNCDDYYNTIHYRYNQFEHAIRNDEEAKLDLEGVDGESFFDEIEKRIKARIDASEEPVVLEYREYRKNKKELDEWHKQQPEIEAWGKECERIHALVKQKEAEGSFTGRHLNKPGVLVEVLEKDEEGTEKLSQYLIGHVNIHRGVCDDCTGFNSSDIIKRYKIVWSESP
jgi:hypothetical protein